jgi:hypothetical protein
MVFQLLQTQLVKRDETEKIIPSLADSWDVSPDATTFTFHLNKDAKWSDGQAVTADDVVYTVQRPSRKGHLHQERDLRDHRVAHEDRRGRRPEHGEVHPEWPELRVPREPDGPGTHDHAEARPVLGRQRSMTTGDFASGKGVVGSGPYTMTNFTPSQTIEFAANPNYFKGAPNPDADLPARSTLTLRRGYRAASWVWRSAQADRQAGAGERAGHQSGADPRCRPALQYLTTAKQMADRVSRPSTTHSTARRCSRLSPGAGRLLWIDAGFDPTTPSTTTAKRRQGEATAV